MIDRSAKSARPALSAMLLGLALFLPARGMAQAPVAPGPAVTPVIPRPADVRIGNGTFRLTPATHWVADDAEAARVARDFSERIRRSRGFAPARAKASQSAAIRFTLARDATLANDDAYVLDVAPRGVTITARTPAGLQYGAATLWQLATADAGRGAATIAAQRIADAPRFAWRGVMLDSARHLQSVAEIKRLLDAMAQLKLNVFHWHLTDDQGWRFPVPGWPKLTTTGACRIPAGDAGIDAKTRKPVPYCGFYSEAQIRDVVAYAAARHITIVPEVDIPGHATAAIAAYPQLGVSGQPVAVSNEWGVNVNLFNADEATMRFLEDVMGQLVKLFPGRYVHIGGDEAVKDQWKASPKMQARIRELGVNGEEGLQAWMIARLERDLSAHGRRVIGWDEILAGKPPPSATVMSWRGAEGAIDAARQGHDVVMAPSSDLYFDYLQTDAPDEIPGRPSLIPLKQVYDFEPVPKALDERQATHVLGVQANVWTEHMRTFARVQHALFPRIAALAEVAWSPQSARGYGDFLQRLPAMLPRWRAQGIAYAGTPFRPIVAAAAHDGGVRVALREPLGYALRYTTDGRAPTAASPQYAAPLDLPLPATLAARAFFGDTPLGAAVTRRFDAASLRTRSDEELATCTRKLVLRLEDDGPRTGDRAIFDVDIFNPCWTWTQAPLAGIGAVEVRAGRIPYFFQLAHDEPSRTFQPATTTHGELELRAGCDGPLLATVPLPAHPDADGFLTLRAPVRNAPAAADLCIRFTGDTRPTMWVLDRVTLVPAALDAGLHPER